ncbi:hypothetical protein F5Y10DRAFT_161602 [Nemania abortiva]|nr:hypothetical protein F5Y10DRAFT_161602 [Nemania abortiva]
MKSSPSSAWILIWLTPGHVHCRTCPRPTHNLGIRERKEIEWTHLVLQLSFIPTYPARGASDWKVRSPCQTTIPNVKEGSERKPKRRHGPSTRAGYNNVG